MPRVKRGTKRRAYRKKTLERASGFFLTKSKLNRAAQEAVEKALRYGFVGRRRKKRDFRRFLDLEADASFAHCGSIKIPGMPWLRRGIQVKGWLKLVLP